MAARKIPTHPRNYKIWSAYRAGTHPDLTKEMDRCIAAGEPFTDEQNETLFERFFANACLSPRLIEVGEYAARELKKISADMLEVGADTASFSTQLSDAAQKILSGASSTELATTLTQIADQTSTMALRNAKLSNALVQSSHHISSLQNELQSAKIQALSDGLTGLANRRLFDETLRQRIKEANVDKTDLCLLLCDVDHFKGMNDRWGHAIGDQLIQFVAHIMRGKARSNWLVARHGGDEFAIIMPHTGLRDALAAATALNAAVQSKLLTRRSTGESLGLITVSIGVTDYRADERSEDLFERADAKLYEAKQRGRNQVCY